MGLVECVVEDDSWERIALQDLAESAASATLSALGLDPRRYAIALLACDDARIAALNSDFRAKPTPTNVLSWPSEDRAAGAPGAPPDLPGPGSPDAPEELGDIAIAYQTVAAEAASGGIALADHTAHLIVHAVLHLLGYDHVRDFDATLMEGLETAILGNLGLPDPYGTDT